jgi:NAD(P)-dependent dehydrogenase (short-subunit alcohol dehydrogenase family)
VEPNEELSEPVPRPGASLSAQLEPELEPQPPDAAFLSGRVALVTGGGWNIGRAIGLALARAGAKVVVASRNRTNLEETAALAAREDLPLRGQVADLTEPDQVEELFAGMAGREGQVEVLFNVAGGYGAARPIHETDARDWWNVVKRNLFSTYLCCRAALPSMLARKRGDIVNCAGGGAFFPMVGVAATAYASAKAAVCRFTDQLYAEHMDVPGLRVNCMEPGMTLSPRDLAAIEAEEKRTGRVNPARERNHPPEDAARLALFLVSPAARRLNGRLLSVDEDWWQNPERVRQVSDCDLYRLRRTFLTE